MKAALERVKGKVDPAKVQIFDLHVLQRWPVPKIARFVKRNRPYIYLCSHKVGRLIAKEIAKLKSKSL